MRHTFERHVPLPRPVRGLRLPLEPGAGVHVELGTRGRHTGERLTRLVLEKEQLMSKASLKFLYFFKEKEKRKILIILFLSPARVSFLVPTGYVSFLEHFSFLCSRFSVPFLDGGKMIVKKEKILHPPEWLFFLATCSAGNTLFLGWPKLHVCVSRFG